MTTAPPSRVLILLPHRDFDPTEVAITWKRLKTLGHRVGFATPAGIESAADPLMLSGQELDAWDRIPGLRKIPLLGRMLRANADARAAYAELQKDQEFRKPLSYDLLKTGDFDGLVLPGGHWSRGMRAFLEDARLHRFVAEFFDADKPVAAICHGVVLAARSLSARSGKSVLHGRKTTALTWELEKSAYSLMRYLGRFWDPGYYRTYSEVGTEPPGFRSVQSEVTRALESPADFLDVTRTANHRFRKASGLFRDSVADNRPAFVVRDGRYVSARWPGDAHNFAHTFAALLTEIKSTSNQQPRQP